MQIDESALTGESFPKDKNTGDEIYAGTIVLSGEGSAQVFATGKYTRLGKIAAASREIRPPKTSLQLAMKSLAGRLVFVALFFSIIIINSRVIKDFLTKGAFLFAGVISVYFYAYSQGLGVKETQTYAFSAWIFGHIALAYISRSDKESIFSLGLFANRVINIWTVSAIAFLILGIYLPFLNDRFNLVAISFTQLILVALAMIFIIGLLELNKSVSHKRCNLALQK